MRMRECGVYVCGRLRVGLYRCVYGGGDCYALELRWLRTQSCTATLTVRL